MNRCLKCGREIGYGVETCARHTPRPATQETKQFNTFAATEAMAKAEKLADERALTIWSFCLPPLGIIVGIAGLFSRSEEERALAQQRLTTAIIVTVVLVVIIYFLYSFTRPIPAPPPISPIR